MGSGIAAQLPSLAFTSTGAVTITNPGASAVPTVAGTPGASLSISGQSVAITDTTLRATAGTLTITSATDITVGGTATLETPGYSERSEIGRSGECGGARWNARPHGCCRKHRPWFRNAAVGRRRKGCGGHAGIVRKQRHVILGGTLDATAPAGGASFELNTGGAFDLSAFANGLAKNFDGTIEITSGTGNLTLSTGEALDATNVGLNEQRPGRCRRYD